MLNYKDRLCVPNINNLILNITAEAHCNRHFIHTGSTNMYHVLNEIYLWEGMKRDISMFVEESPYCQQIKVKHLKPRGLTLSNKIPT